MQLFSELRLNTADQIQEICTIPCNWPHQRVHADVNHIEHRCATRLASVVDLDVHTAKAMGLVGMVCVSGACSAMPR